MILFFVPIRYRLHAECKEAQKPNVTLELSYFFHMIRMTFLYTNDSFLKRTSLFGIKISPKRQKESAPLEEDDWEEEVNEQDEDKSEVKEATSIASTEDANQETSKKKQKDTKQGHPLKALSELKNILLDEKNHLILNKIILELKYLIKHFRFRKIKADIRYSAKEPALTGQIYGMLCMIPYFYQKGISIEPDFESEVAYARGTVFASGKIRGIHLILSIARLILDKDIRIKLHQIFK